MNDTIYNQIRTLSSSCKGNKIYLHTFSKWKSDNGQFTIEGDWNAGAITGKAVENWSSGDRLEYEASNSIKNGKHIQYTTDAARYKESTVMEKSMGDKGI